MLPAVKRIWSCNRPTVSINVARCVPSCCEFEGDGDITPELKLRNNHGVTGLHRDCYHVFQHVVMASDLTSGPYLDRCKLNRQKLISMYC